MNLFSAIWEALPIEVKGALLALGMTFLRHHQAPKAKSFKAIFIEGLISSGLTLSISAALIILAKMDPYISIAVGGLLGYMGPAWAVAKLETKLNSKLDEDNRE
jgi:uncharacterized RDD family membrane protein YckC